MEIQEIESGILITPEMEMERQNVISPGSNKTSKELQNDNFVSKIDIKTKFNELITNGEQAKNINLKNSDYTGQYISGEEYVKWISDCVIFLEKHNNFNKTMVDRFIKASERANGNDTGHYDVMIGILKSLSEAEE